MEDELVDFYPPLVQDPKMEEEIESLKKRVEILETFLFS